MASWSTVGWSSSTSSNWQALRALSGRERALLAAATLLLPCTTAGLKLFGYRRVDRLSRRVACLGPPPAPAEREVAIKTDRMVKAAAARLPVPSACLSRSMVLRTLLRAQGVESELRIGVRRGLRDLQAHAWVEHDGRPLNDAEDVARRFPTLPLPPM